jgi:SAM-dependent methyltransferase
VSQRAQFIAGEGDAYYARNASPSRLAEGGSALADDDPVLATLRPLALAPRSVLEIGASDGARLEALRVHRPSACYVALEPSHLALAASAVRFPALRRARATAERLPFARASFELVILGFCLYLVDREDLFSVAAEVDRVLAPGGHVVVFDFLPDAPHRRRYAHADGAYSFKMDHARMFTWNPAYLRVAQQTFTHPGGDAQSADDRLAVSVLRRDLARGWPERS